MPKPKHPEFVSSVQRSLASVAMTEFILSTKAFTAKQVQSAGDQAIGYAGEYGLSPCYRLADYVLQFERRRRRIVYQGGAARLWIRLEE